MAEEKKEETSDAIEELLQKYYDFGRGKIIDDPSFQNPNVSRYLASHILHKYSNTCGKLYISYCPKKKEFCDKDEHSKMIIKIKKCIKNSKYNNILVNFDFSDLEQTKGRSLGHRNLFVIHRFSNQIIRFEPNGSTGQQFDNTLEVNAAGTLFATELSDENTTYTFINTPAVCPIEGVQKAMVKAQSRRDLNVTIHEPNTCVLWSLLILELFLVEDKLNFNVLLRKTYNYLTKNGTLVRQIRFVRVLRGFYFTLIEEITQVLKLNKNINPVFGNYWGFLIQNNMPYKMLLQEGKEATAHERIPEQKDELLVDSLNSKKNFVVLNNRRKRRRTTKGGYKTPRRIRRNHKKVISKKTNTNTSERKTIKKNNFYK